MMSNRLQFSLICAVLAKLFDNKQDLEPLVIMFHYPDLAFLIRAPRMQKYESTSIITINEIKIAIS